MTLHGHLYGTNLSANEIIKNLKLLKTEDIVKLELAKFMHKASNGNLPSSFKNHFIEKSSMHNYQLRSLRNNKFYRQKAKTAEYKRSLAISGVDLWATIDQGLKTLPFFLFSRKYKHNIIDRY